MKGFPVTGILFLCLIFAGKSDAHNITQILDKFPEFSTFNHYLTLTHLAPEINRREVITICAVDNAGMSKILSEGLPFNSIKVILSLHILLDYFGAKRLDDMINSTTLAATMLQDAGIFCFVNITRLEDGKVGIGAEVHNGTLEATFIKPLAEIPYNISVIHISKTLTPPTVKVPAPAPCQLSPMALMSEQGCQVFADLLFTTGVYVNYQQEADGGLTVFCPIDRVFEDFMPKYKNLTADEKVSLLLYHGVPIYQSLAMLGSNNGLMNTLATNGDSRYALAVENNGEVVTLETLLVTANITGTLVDEMPWAIFTIDKVLEPHELFHAGAGDGDQVENATLSQAPTPSPPIEPDIEGISPSEMADHDGKSASPLESDIEGLDISPSETGDDDGIGRFFRWLRRTVLG